MENKLKVTVHDVGFLGVGEYKATEKGKATKSYKAWYSMLSRCYNDKTQDLHPTYIGCTVCKEWHNFQNFAKWFESNYSDGLHMDKDIKIEGNKIYSPEGCMFVSIKDNTVKARAKLFHIVSPEGVHFKGRNVGEFCRRTGLDPSNISKVITGKCNHCKGWTSGKQSI